MFHSIRLPGNRRTANARPSARGSSGSLVGTPAGLLPKCPESPVSPSSSDPARGIARPPVVACRAAHGVVMSTRGNPGETTADALGTRRPACRICRLSRSSCSRGREGGGPGLPRPAVPRLRPPGRARGRATLEERIGKAEGKGVRFADLRLEAGRPDRDEDAGREPGPALPTGVRLLGPPRPEPAPVRGPVQLRRVLGRRLRHPVGQPGRHADRQGPGDALGAAGVPVPGAGGGAGYAGR